MILVWDLFCDGSLVNYTKKVGVKVTDHGHFKSKWNCLITQILNIFFYFFAKNPCVWIILNLFFIQIAILFFLVGFINCRGEPAGGKEQPGFSYSRFSGPVSGPEHEILVTDKHGNSKVDYVAKPDYSFAYGVEDPKSKVSQSRKETRHGDAVVGEYSVVEPDGTLRTVRYTADKKNGFQAEIITNGKSQSGGGGQVAHVVPAPASDIKPVHEHHESQQLDGGGESRGSSDEDADGIDGDNSEEDDDNDDDEEY